MLRKTAKMLVRWRGLMAESIHAHPNHERYLPLAAGFLAAGALAAAGFAAGALAAGALGFAAVLGAAVFGAAAFGATALLAAAFGAAVLVAFGAALAAGLAAATAFAGALAPLVEVAISYPFNQVKFFRGASQCTACVKCDVHLAQSNSLSRERKRITPTSQTRLCPLAFLGHQLAQLLLILSRLGRLTHTSPRLLNRSFQIAHRFQHFAVHIAHRQVIGL